MRSWGGLHDIVSNSVLGLPKNSDVKPAFAIGEGEAIFLSRRSSGSGGSGGTSGLPHPPVLVAKATKWVHSLDAWMLSALFSACAESKSFFIGAALIHEAMMNGGVVVRGDAVGGEDENNNHNALLASTTTMEHEGGEKNHHATTIIRDGKWAVEAARVEEEFNIECWGLVEGGHDYDRLNCSIQMHAASFLARTVASGG
jgi:ATP synthase F1 complex assembly factor 2